VTRVGAAGSSGRREVIRLGVDHEHFKATLRRWASGVSIITTCAGDRVLGMTASAFTSVSLDPPLVLVCVEKKAHTLPLIEESHVFAVNVLASDQRALSTRFATDGNEAVRFEGLACRRGETGAPRLPGVLAVLDCKVVAAHEAGDHVIYVGEVLDTEYDETREPLLYYDARYRGLAPR
jgi:flavin reductase (DIM6/NTAB) family NADH-FMN oxidoreductase RutF